MFSGNQICEGFCEQENLGREEEFAAGEIIFEEGASPRALYCVHSGKVKLHQNDAEGREQIIRLVRPGDMIGHRALLSETAFSASATALEASVICVIPGDAFMKRLYENQDLNRRMIKLLAANLAESDRRIAEMAYKPVRERTAEALLLLIQTYGDPSSSEPFSFRLSRSDLAALVGTAKETLVRVLSEFKEKGAIEMQGRTTVILDPGVLRDVL